MFYEGVDDSVRIFAVDFREHDITRLTFDECCYLAILAAEQKVPFPVTGYRTVFGRSWTFANRYRVNDSTVNAGLLRVVARTAHSSCAPQMRHQLLLQSPTGLNEQAAINGLV